MQVIDATLERALAAAAAAPAIPCSTYRLQFHAGFTFRDAAAVVPYLADLGITHCYASPYLKAAPGSTHGYDVVDPRSLNPELGTEADYLAWIATLRHHGMGHILDTVPNHMGVATNENPWWNDVLEHGPASAHAHFFDIDWSPPRPELGGKLLLPILGDLYAAVLEKGELRLSFERGAFFIRYYDRCLPINHRTYELILGPHLDELPSALGASHPALAELQAILDAADQGPSPSIKQRLAALAAGEPRVQRFIEHALAVLNGTPGQPGSFDRLHDLLERQSYRLAFWKVASDEINYRRFFDVNELAALNMEHEDVFTTTHALILRLLAKKTIDGLRIDHPDGLYDPRRYFLWLQTHYVLARVREILRPQIPGETEWARIQPLLRQRIQALFKAGDGAASVQWPLYVVAEKILAVDEPLPAAWAVSGTSGYDFLNMANGLFVDTRNESSFTTFYREFTGELADFTELACQKKRMVLQTSFSSELHSLAHHLDRLAQQDRHWRDFTLRGLRHALREVIACFPVYRCYACGPDLAAADQQHIHFAIEEAIRRNPLTSPALFNFLRDILLLRMPADATEHLRDGARRFVGRFQQLTAPVTAKGIEDTAFYVYTRFISLNEVGGDPGRFGVCPERLHDYLRGRQTRWPHGLSALSTHDTKRSEDVRARLNLLSEIPEQWQQRVRAWSDMNRPLRQQVGHLMAPDANEEYFLYQTLFGAWPLEPCSAEEFRSFPARIQSYMTKALREAKVHTRWADPDAAYESAIHQFIARIFDQEMAGGAGGFRADLRDFLRPLAPLGLINSLSQSLLRLAAPGVPDIYQGCELWDFSLVDPDNRRPVDFALRARMLADLQSQLRLAGADRRALVQDLLATLPDSRMKLYVTAQSLHCRRRLPDLFAFGDYLPLEPTGPLANHVFAFARRHRDQWALAVIPRLLTGLVSPAHSLPIGRGAWSDTTLSLPPDLPGIPLQNIFTGEMLHVEQDGRGPRAHLATLLATCPIALFATAP